MHRQRYYLWHQTVWRCLDALDYRFLYPTSKYYPRTFDGYSLVLGAGRCIFLSFWGRLRSNSLFSLTGNKRHTATSSILTNYLQLKLDLLLVPLQAPVCCIHFYLMLLHIYKSNKKTEVICKHFKTHLVTPDFYLLVYVNPNACYVPLYVDHTQ